MTITMSSNNRKVTTNEIAAVGAILKDIEALKLLKQINDQVVTEEDTKGKRKQNDIFAFVGFAHQDDVLGEDPESEDFKNKQGSLKHLVDTGLILEGFHVPLERKNEKKFGDVHLPATDQKVGKYKLTEEGLAVLALVTKPQQQTSTKTTQQKPVVTTEPAQPASVQISKKEKQITAEAVKEVSAANKKEKAIADFKKDVKEENK